MCVPPCCLHINRVHDLSVSRACHPLCLHCWPIFASWRACACKVIGRHGLHTVQGAPLCTRTGLSGCTGLSVYRFVGVSSFAQVFRCTGLSGCHVVRVVCQLFEPGRGPPNSVDMPVVAVDCCCYRRPLGLCSVCLLLRLIAAATEALLGRAPSSGLF